MANPVNSNFIQSACAAALAGITALQAAGANATKYAAYFGGSGVLTQADFVGQYTSMSPTMIGQAISSIAAVSSVLTANGNAYANALTKIARSSGNGPGFGGVFGGGGSGPTPTPAQITAGAKAPNCSFINSVVMTASAGVKALTSAGAIAQQYSTYFAASLQQADFAANYGDLTPADIANAMAAVGAVEAALAANGNQLLGYLLAIAI